MRVFPSETYVARRAKLKAKMGKGLLLFMGNNESSINYKDNCYPFRQDSTFLYFFGLDIPGLAAIIDIDQDKEVIFGDDGTIEDSIWTGAVPNIRELASRAGVSATSPRRALEKAIQDADRGRVLYLPPFRHDNRQEIAALLGIGLHEVDGKASITFVRAVAGLRSYKTAEELIEINKAVDITADMHLAVMESARAGQKEHFLAGVAHGRAISAGGQLSFPIILTVNGQILHNHFHGNTLQEGQMVLCDAGAENDMHYAGDLTRTFPVGPRFTDQQRDIYEIVLNAYRTAVAALKPGIRFRDIHLLACRQLAEGLKSIGLMKGNMEDAVHLGAHAMFFQCGVGHMMGLDVHDMEDLGEQYVGYEEGVEKSTQFGLKSLRLGRALEENFVVTVEPGIYFIPELMDLWGGEKRYSDYIHYGNLMKYRSFGGIRVEDDFVITQNGSKLLGKPLPTTVEEIEQLRTRSLSSHP